MLRRIRSLARRAARSYVLVVVLGLVVGLTLAPVAWSAGTSPEKTVAVVPVEGSIDAGAASAYAATMERARQDPNVAAVVLVANSGGGSASASEDMYLQTKRTAERMPVVTSIDAGALSGAYYTVAASDYIYAKPSSLVGSIGVLSRVPINVEPNNIIATSGPNKLSGYDQREFFYLLDSLQRSFVGAVIEQRGDALELSRADVEQARIYSGAQATGNGLADEIGGKQAAIQEAARRAGLSDYRVRVLRPDGRSVPFLSRNNYLASDAPDKRMVGPEYLTGSETAAPVFLMVPGAYVASAETNRSYLRGSTVTDATASRAGRAGAAAGNATGVADASG